MGSILYDFLGDSFLFNERQVENAFSGISDSELTNELQRYREFCLQNVKALEKEIGDGQSELKVFTGVQSPPVNLLKQSAFYIEQFIISDPLFAEYTPSHNPSEVMREYLGFDNHGLDRQSLVSVIHKMKALSPMVAADFVKILPISHFFEAPKEIPIYHSENNYIEGIPEPLINFFHTNAKVESLNREKSALVTTGKLFPCRSISVEFADESPGEGMLFQLFENQIVSTNKQEGTAKVKFNLPEQPPEKALFDAWVKQSINRTSSNILRRTTKQIQMASTLNSSFMTDSRFVSNLLKQTVAPKSEINTATANQLLKLDLPFIDKIDTTTLMELRVNDGESFQNFRKELERQFRELRSIKDADQLKIKAENALHELSEVQVRQVQQKVAFLKRKLFVDSAILFGGLAGTIQTGGWSLLASGVAAARGYQSIQDYYQNTRQNPAFFLWKALDQSK